jgi:hypothetical protein
LFALLHDRSDADRRLVFEALSERVRGERSDLDERYLDALAACAQDLGVLAPSVSEYERWRTGVPDGEVAPSSGQLRRRFGSWTLAVCSLAGVAGHDPTARRLLSSGRPFTRAQAVAAVTAFLSEHARPEIASQKEYCVWAAGRIVAGERVPAAPKTLNRLIGRWRDVLRAAGVEPPPAAVRQASERRPARFGREEALSALRDCYREIGGPMTQHRYDGWSRACDERGEARPRACGVARILGSWQEAVERELEPAARLGVRRRRYLYTDAQLRSALEDCVRDLGRPPSELQYEVWRCAEPRRPSKSVLIARVGDGTWRGVLAAVDRTR